MTEGKKKKKKYEPPMVKEIGGVFEQAMGVSQCTTGAAFTSGACNRGTSAGAGCAAGRLDQACAGGATDAGACSRGFFATGGCNRGPGG